MPATKIPRWTAWSDAELAFLDCPISAAALSLGALRGRSEWSISWKRRDLRRETVMAGSGYPGRPLSVLADYPGVDWTKPLREIMRRTGMGSHVAVRLRQEAGAVKPLRTGRRAYKHSDFDVDWATDSTRNLTSKTGLSRQVVYRLKREFHKYNLQTGAAAD